MIGAVDRVAHLLRLPDRIRLPICDRYDQALGATADELVRLGIAEYTDDRRPDSMSQTPSVGRVVHYVSHGTPVRPDGSQEYPSQCRAAIVTAVDTYQPGDEFVGHVSLCVLNPEGMFFNRAVLQNDGAETPGAPDCPNTEFHGSPHRYCQCGWTEAHYTGGTWHWPERV